jgi:hypothetical protein
MPGNEVQIHLWPWSIGIGDESINVSQNENINFSFYGSPILSFPEGVRFFLDHRYERFTPLGSPYKSKEESHQTCESPNMDLTPSESGYRGGFNGQLRLQTAENEFCTFRFNPLGARPRFKNKDDQAESLLHLAVIAWSQFFDDIIEKSIILDERSNELSWSSVFQQIEKFSDQKQQPRMALIVKISQSMNKQIALTVRSARRILKRKREMVPVDRLAEMDMACIRWQARQPGRDIVEKAGLNNQTLLGIAREESFNTLENRVLKEFIGRCRDEAKKYIKNEVGSDVNLKGSLRYSQVREFQNRCDELYKDEKFSNVKEPPTSFQTNYVLQNDIRYRKVWTNYLKILRKENEKDQVWDWQSRTWADVARLLINATIIQNVGLFEVTDKKKNIKNKIIIEELYKSTIRVNQEQHLGSRVVPGSEPGPFFIYNPREKKSKGYILEVVHPHLMEKHSDTNELGMLGGHLYLVLKPISGGRKTIIVVWAIHLAATTLEIKWKEIVSSAKEALANHGKILSKAENSCPITKGIILASDLDMNEPDMHKLKNIMLFQIPVDQRFWKDAIDYLKMHFQDLFVEILSQ